MEVLEIQRKEKGEIERLTNRTFQFDRRIGEGFYSANYFLKSRAIVQKMAPGHIVEEQFFQRREEAMACGIDEAIALLQEFAVHPEALREKRGAVNGVLPLFLRELGDFCLPVLCDLKLQDIGFLCLPLNFLEPP